MRINKHIEKLVGVQEIKEWVETNHFYLPDEVKEGIDSGSIENGTLYAGMKVALPPVIFIALDYEGIQAFVTTDAPILSDYLYNNRVFPSRVIFAIMETMNKLIREQSAKLTDKLHHNKGTTVHNGHLKVRPSNPSLELRTIRDMDCLTELREWVNKKTFVIISKNILKGDTAMGVLAKPKDNDEDTRYMVIVRIGEIQNDPLETKLLGMVAYQPDVLKNGVMFNSEIDEEMKERFMSEYNKYIIN